MEKKSKTTKSVWKIKEDIAKWLTRIGVHEADIVFGKCDIVEKRVRYDTVKHDPAKVEYAFKGQAYKLYCDKDKVYTQNLNYIQILIHSRVIGIERGIESLEQAFAGYTALPESTGYFSECKDIDAVTVKYKRLAKALHPDAGGDPEQFTSMKKEYEDALARCE